MERGPDFGWLTPRQFGSDLNWGRWRPLEQTEALPALHDLGRRNSAKSLQILPSLAKLRALLWLFLCLDMEEIYFIPYYNLYFGRNVPGVDVVPKNWRNQTVRRFHVLNRGYIPMLYDPCMVKRQFPLELKHMKHIPNTHCCVKLCWTWKLVPPTNMSWVIEYHNTTTINVFAPNYFFFYIFANFTGTNCYWRRQDKHSFCGIDLSLDV